MTWDGKERRKNRVPTNFTPETAFEGFVVAKLEAIDEKLKAMPCDKKDLRLSKCESDIANIKGKATIIGAIAGFISAWIGKHLIGK